MLGFMPFKPESPIQGQKGNREYLIHCVPTGNSLSEEDIRKVVGTKFHLLNYKTIEDKLGECPPIVGWIEYPIDPHLQVVSYGHLPSPQK
ncbi:MAG: hypothetical protein Ct9H300mP23_04300 [Nitrospinota bacterium]|nr:MAG: hypothetical protein Ct9H300mP23_04300 [Nitrospinota bacterium]